MIKKYLPLAASVAFIFGIAWTAENAGFGHKPNFNKIEAEEEKEGENSFEGAVESFYSMRLNEKTGTLDPAWYQAALAQADAKRMSSRLNKSIVWDNMGPDNVGGRCRALLIDRDSAHLMWLGSVSGGLFRSRSAGQSWTPINDLQENLSVTCIGQTPNGDVYYGTGEGGFTNSGGNKFGSPAFVGGGIFYSNDRGKSFKRLANTNNANYFECNTMVAHPTEQKIYVGTQTGLFLLTNNGASAVKVTAITGSVKEIKIQSTGEIWCSTGSGLVYKSDASGANWVNAKYGTAGGRVAIAISPQDEKYVYLQGATNGSNFAGIWRTTTGGTATNDWSQIVYPNTMTNILSSQGSAQGYYNNVVAVDPIDKNRIYCGGVEMGTWDEANGFQKMASLNDAPWNTSFIHADKHIIQFNKHTSPQEMIVGTDGGLYFSTNRNTWTPRSRGFTSLQLYNVAANEYEWVVGGSQDNGTQLINNNGNMINGQRSKNAFEIFGGDGFDVEFSRYDPTFVFVSTYYGVIARSANGGQSTSTFWDERIKPDATQNNPPQTDFNTTFSLYEPGLKQSRLFLAKNNDVWMAVNPTDVSNDVKWFKIATGLNTNRIYEIDHTADGDHLFIAKAGLLYRVDSLNSAVFSTTLYPGATTIPSPIVKVNITPPQASGRTITSVNVDEANKDHVVLTMGGYGNTVFVLESKNATSAAPTWTNITGDLPSIPVYDAVIDMDDPKRIILGTDLGIWVSENGGANWEEANTGMARVPVWEIRGYEFRPWEGMTMYLGTHGRGYYQSKSLRTVANKTIEKTLHARLYPNPANKQINLNFEMKAAGKVSIAIFDMKGQQVLATSMQANAGSNESSMRVEQLKAGYYFARISSGKESQTVKFAITR